METPPLQHVAPTLENTTPVTCDKCKHSIFIDAAMFRKQSALLSKTGKATIITIPIAICGNCGKPLEDLLPKELKTPSVTHSNIVT